MTKPYIHGFSRDEQFRLVEQARVLAPNVFRGIDFSRAREALEIGCGVGAELKIMCERWPQLRLTGLDWSQSHLMAAKHVLSKERATGRVRVVRADALRLPFPDHTFDLAITIWMLEHVSAPERILREAVRALKPGGVLVCTEVDNSTFGFDPDNAVITAWWNRFNEYQQSAGGDPFVGKKLRTLAECLNCRKLTTRVIQIISSRREPRRRGVLLDYLRNLLLSGSENMIRNGMVDARQREGLVDAFDRVKRAPDVQFQYDAVRLVCQASGEIETGPECKREGK